MFINTESPGRQWRGTRIQARHGPDILQPRGRDDPIELGREPIDCRIDEFVWCFAIAVDAVLDAVSQRRLDERRHLEIHVGDPERQDVPVLVFGPFAAASAAPFDDLIEFVHERCGDWLLERSCRRGVQSSAIALAR
jgi:hypothetical protein